MPNLGIVIHKKTLEMLDYQMSSNKIKKENLPQKRSKYIEGLIVEDFLRHNPLYDPKWPIVQGEFCG